MFIFVSTAFKHYHRIPIFHYRRYTCYSRGVLPYISQPCYPESLSPLTSGLEGSDPRKSLIAILKISDYQLNCACLPEKTHGSSLRNQVSDILLPTSVAFIVFRNNDNRSCDGTLKSCSFRYEEDLRNENV